LPADAGDTQIYDFKTDKVNKKCAIYMNATSEENIKWKNEAINVDKADKLKTEKCIALETTLKDQEKAVKTADAAVTAQKKIVGAAA